MSFVSSFFSVFSPSAAGVRSIEPPEAARLVRARQAVLVDVREPAEWSGGVAADAALLPLSDLTGARREWRPFLEKVAGREIILYCHSGARCRLAGRVLAGEGFKAASIGSLRAWQSAGLPVIRPKTAR